MISQHSIMTQLAAFYAAMPQGSRVGWAPRAHQSLAHQSFSIRHGDGGHGVPSLRLTRSLQQFVNNCRSHEIPMRLPRIKGGPDAANTTVCFQCKQHSSASDGHNV